MLMRRPLLLLLLILTACVSDRGETLPPLPTATSTTHGLIVSPAPVTGSSRPWPVSPAVKARRKHSVTSTVLAPPTALEPPAPAVGVTEPPAVEVPTGTTSPTVPSLPDPTTTVHTAPTQPPTTKERRRPSTTTSQADPGPTTTRPPQTTRPPAPSTTPKPSTTPAPTTTSAPPVTTPPPTQPVETAPPST